jgi:2-dehydropantoate 2-reductase
MKVAVVGGGAMGGVWAACLASAGNDVTVVDASPQVVDALNGEGLVVERDGAIQKVRVRAVQDPGEIGKVDVVFFFVKAHHTSSAAQASRPLAGTATTVVSLQNGWGNADVLARNYPPEQIVVGVTYHGATVKAPGRVAHTGRGDTFVGPYVDGAPLERARKIADLMEGAGLPATPTPEVKTEIWKKLVLNAATLPPAALTGLSAGELGQPGPLLDLVDELAAEAVAVGQALGYAVDRRERVERIHTVLEAVGPGKGSMLQDVEARRKTEIEVINGAVVRAATEQGVEVPLNRAMVALVQGLERSWLA